MPPASHLPVTMLMTSYTNQILKIRLGERLRCCLAMFFMMLYFASPLFLFLLLLEEKDSLLERRNFYLKNLLFGAEDLDNCSVQIVQSL